MERDLGRGWGGGMRRGGVARGLAGQGDGEPCREVGVEGATDRVKRLASRRFFRAWVSPVLVAAMWVLPFHFESVDFLLP